MTSDLVWQKIYGVDLALIIAIVALAAAIPGTIDATWNVIAKLRALKKGGGVDPLPKKKSKKLHLDGVTTQASKSPRKSKKEGNNWAATAMMNAMRLARRVPFLNTSTGDPVCPKRKNVISQEDFDETPGGSILKKSFMPGIYA